MEKKQSLILSAKMIKRAYLIIGLITIIIFLITGRYLRIVYPDKDAMDMAYRIMLRSRHLAILFSGVGLTFLGVYFTLAKNKWILLAQQIATLFLILANILIIYCFFYEADVFFVPATPIFHLVAYLILAGLVLHLTKLFDTEKI
jgi:magnesium-transporting ATPase (P-type)